MPEVVGTVDNGISRACLGLNLRILVRCIIVSQKKKFQNEKLFFGTAIVIKEYKSGFGVHCLFTGQFNTKGYGAFTDVI